MFRFCYLFGLFVSLLNWHHTASCLHAQQEDDDQLVQLVVQLLGDADKDMRALALEQIRSEVPGKAATRKFAALLPDMKPEVQVELIRALTDRADAAACPSIVELLKATDDSRVRIAAIRALGFMGESKDDLQLLLDWLSQGTKDEAAAARTSLVRLPGESFSQALTAELKQGDPDRRIPLMEILVARRASSAASAMLPLAVDRDPAVRAAAVKALSQLAGPEQVPGLVQAILVAERGRERESVEKAVMMVCHRSEDADQQAAPLLAAMRDLNDAERAIVIPTLGRVGGAQALKLVKAALASPDSKIREAGFRALCNWPDASVAPDLIALARNGKHPGDGTTAVRALIRIAPLPDGRTDAEKLELLKKAWPLCRRDEERKLVLQRASAIRIIETLRFLVDFLDQPKLAQQACQSIVELAHHRGLREPNKDEFHQALEKVKKTSKDPIVIERANRYQRGETWSGKK